jgi:hypothetical protein
VKGEVSGEISGDEGVSEVFREISEEGSVSLGFGIAEGNHIEHFGLAVLEGEEWLQRVREIYERDTYFREVLAVLREASG